jgi:ketosteroid isomerase-like protein
MPDSPLAAVLEAIDALDVDAFVSLFAPDGNLLTTNGTVGHGTEHVRAVIGDFIGELYGTTHTVTAQWHPEDGVWIAEVDATYDVKQHGRLGPYPRAVVLHQGPGGITELRFYGMHELPLATSTRPYQDVVVDGHWLATL